MGQPGVAVEAGIAQRGILVAAEGKHRPVHLLDVEDLEAHQQVEVLYREAGDGQEQVGLEPGDHVLQGVLAEVG